MILLVKPLAPRHLCCRSKASEPDVSTDPPASTEVEIFGAVYRVRGSDQERLQGLADLVDRRIREVAQHVSTADPTRLAILAALNLADELFRAQRQQEEERVEIREKVAALAGELSRALDGWDGAKRSNSR
jgi:cell division protein ZapA